MKNHLWIAMALAAVLMTTGCAGKGAQNQTQAPAEQAQEQVQEEATVEQSQAEPAAALE